MQKRVSRAGSCILLIGHVAGHVDFTLKKGNGFKSVHTAPPESGQPCTASSGAESPVVERSDSSSVLIEFVPSPPVRISAMADAQSLFLLRERCAFHISRARRTTTVRFPPQKPES